MTGPFFVMLLMYGSSCIEINYVLSTFIFNIENIVFNIMFQACF